MRSQSVAFYVTQIVWPLNLIAEIWSARRGGPNFQSELSAIQVFWWPIAAWSLQARSTQYRTFRLNATDAICKVLHMGFNSGCNWMPWHNCGLCSFDIIAILYSFKTWHGEELADLVHTESKPLKIYRDEETSLECVEICISLKKCI